MAKVNSFLKAKPSTEIGKDPLSFISDVLKGEATKEATDCLRWEIYRVFEEAKQHIDAVFTGLKSNAKYVEATYETSQMRMKNATEAAESKVLETIQRLSSRFLTILEDEFILRLVDPRQQKPNYSLVEKVLPIEGKTENKNQTSKKTNLENEALNQNAKELKKKYEGQDEAKRIAGWEYKVGEVLANKYESSFSSLQGNLRQLFNAYDSRWTEVWADLKTEARAGGRISKEVAEDEAWEFPSNEDPTVTSAVGRAEARELADEILDGIGTNIPFEPESALVAKRVKASLKGKALFLPFSDTTHQRIVTPSEITALLAQAVGPMIKTSLPESAGLAGMIANGTNGIATLQTFLGEAFQGSLGLDAHLWNVSSQDSHWRDSIAGIGLAAEEVRPALESALQWNNRVCTPVEGHFSEKHRLVVQALTLAVQPKDLTVFSDMARAWLRYYATHDQEESQHGTSSSTDHQTDPLAWKVFPDRGGANGMGGALRGILSLAGVDAYENLDHQGSSVEPKPSEPNPQEILYKLMKRHGLERLVTEPKQ